MTSPPGRELGADVPLRMIAPGLYAVPQTDAGACLAYFLYKDGSLTTSLTLAESWTTYGGAYLFCAQPIDLSGSPAFPDLARKALFPAPLPQAWHAFIWLPDADSLSAAQSLAFTGQRPVILTTPARVTVGDVGINFASSFNPVVALGDDPVLGPAFTLSAAAANAVRLSFGTATADVHTIGSPSLWTMTLPVAGALAGSLVFDVGLDTGQLQACLGMGFVYGYGAAETAASLFFPMAQPQVPSRSPTQFPDFTFMANPARPYDGSTTRLSWTGNTPLPPFGFQSATLAATGSPVPTRAETVFATPAPATGTAFAGGFGLHKAPASTRFPGAPEASGPPAPVRSYLAPVGAWTLSLTMPPSAPAADTPLWLMPGLALSEFLAVADGETVFFACAQPAHAAGFSPSASTPARTTDGSLLADTFTTSGLTILPGGGANAGRGYYSQPTAAPFFAPLPGEPTLMALAVRAGKLDAPAPFPFVPYGGIGAALPAGGGACNPGVPAATFLGFESQVLGTARHQALASAAEGPALLPLFSSSGPPSPLQATTPVGLLIDLHDDGTFRKLTLARAPDAALASPLGLAELSIAGAGSGTPPFPADLSLALTQNDLMLVVSRADSTWDFRNRILVDGFEFRFDLSGDGAILVFKSNTTASLADLAARPSLWTQPDHFNADAQAVSAALTAAIAEARADVTHAADSPFHAFVAMADDPAWTGVIAFNAAIDGSNMPADLQMLLGGINGSLHAHHFGIEANQLAPLGGSGTGLRIDQSSLFGVIYYRDPGDAADSPPPDLQYRLELLSVVFSNSKVTQFNAKVGLVLNALFGRPLTLLSPMPSPPLEANTLVLKGQYQTQNGVGQVTFRTLAPYLYAFKPPSPGASQVLSEIHMAGASLVPTGTTSDGSGARKVRARFQIGGELWFSASPFPVPDPIDLFSYGAAGSGGTGLPFANMGIDLTFDLDANGATIPGSQTLAFDPSTLVAAPTASAIRPNSLLSALPLRFSKFLAPTQPLTAARAGAQTVHVLQLETLAGDADAGSPVPTSPPMPVPAVSAQSPYGTTSASYALEYDMTLGSLGKLSDLGVSLTAKLLLAWGPSPTIPDNDAAAVLIQLPQLNAGVAGFALQGILKTTFGDANLLKVDLDGDALTYAMLFSNVQLSLFGYTFPPGVLIDFLLFAGPPNGSAPTNTNNLAWFVSAQQQ